MLVHLEGVHPHPEKLRHLLIRPSIHVFHNEGLALLGGELAQRGLQGRPQLAPVQPLVGPIAARGVHVLHRDSVAPPGHRVAALVGEDPEEPGPEAVRLPARSQRVEGPDEGLLQRVLRRVPVAHGRDGVPPEFGAVALDEDSVLLKRLLKQQLKLTLPLLMNRILLISKKSIPGSI